MFTRKMFWTVAGIGVAGLTTVVATSMLSKPGSVPPVVSGQPAIAVDCGLVTYAAAWVDENANGIQEASEAPLPSVRFELDDRTNGRANVAKAATSEADGVAVIREFLPGCPKVEFVVRSVTPFGYSATTPSAVPASDHVRFGFMKAR